MFLNLSISDKVLAERQKRAVELKKCTDRAASMSENEVNELRHDIKVCYQRMILLN